MSKPRILSLCTGYGGLDMAVRNVFGGELAYWSDIEPGPIAVMQHHHPDVPNLGDLKEIDWASLGDIDIITAGYPCQPFSSAGLRKGVEDERHLWPYIARGIGILRPSLVVLENVAAHLRRGFDAVAQDLAEIGYDATWTTLRASDVGACHRRERLWIIATTADTPHELRDWAGSAGEGRGHELTDGSREAAEAVTLLPTPTSTNRGGNRANSRGELLLPGVATKTETWGEYAPAVARHEKVFGRPAPHPTVTGARGGQVLSPYFVEWMMGLPEGHVTGVPGLSRNAQLKLLGNGVVPRQAEAAIRLLLPYATDYRAEGAA